MSKHKYILSLILLSIGLTNYAQNIGSLIVEIESCRNDDGVVVVAIFDKEEGFAESEENMVQTANVNIKDGKAVLEFKDLAFGEYAISAFHDENSNGELDTNWIGIPKEGVGASNNAKGRMGPPKYEDAKLNFEKDQQKMQFEIDYIF